MLPVLLESVWALLLCCCRQQRIIEIRPAHLQNVADPGVRDVEIAADLGNLILARCLEAVLPGRVVGDGRHRDCQRAHLQPYLYLF